MAIDLPQGGFDDQFKILVRFNKLLQKSQIFPHFGKAKDTLLSLGRLVVKSRQIWCYSQSLDFCTSVYARSNFQSSLNGPVFNHIMIHVFLSWCSVNQEHYCSSLSWPSLSSEHISNFYLFSEKQPFPFCYLICGLQILIVLLTRIPLWSWLILNNFAAWRILVSA